MKHGPIPDRPVKFGYKQTWLAIREVDSQAVVNALGLEDTRVSTWKEGIERAYEHGYDRGAEHPDVALSLVCLANVYSAQGKYAKAEPLLKRALSIDENALPADHPNMAEALEFYATLLKATNRDADAEKLLVRAKTIRSRLNQ
jgi:tetratricopeptide (TPR) repeat protein